MSGRPPGYWVTLGIGRDATEKEVRRAYATKLKQIDTSRDQEGFEILRAAYELALLIARGRARAADHPAPMDEDVAAPPSPVLEMPISHLAVAADIVPLPDLTAPFETMRSLLRSEDYSIAAWNALLNDPLLDSPQVSARFEHALVEAMAEHRIDVVLTASPEWRNLIESRYGWIADGLRYARSFPQHGELRQVLVSLRKPKVRQRRSIGEIISSVIPAWPPVWFFLFIVYVLLHAGWTYYKR